jgi:hypothetical protein
MDASSLQSLQHASFDLLQQAYRSYLGEGSPSKAQLQAVAGQASPQLPPLLQML